MPTYLMKNLISAPIEDEMNSNEYREILFNIQVMMTFANDMKYIIMRNRHSELDINDYPEYKPAPQPEYLRDICLSLKEIFMHFGKLDVLADEMSRILTLTQEDEHALILGLRADLERAQNKIKNMTTDHRSYTQDAVKSFDAIKNEIDLILSAPLSKKEIYGNMKVLVDRIDSYRADLLNHWSDIPF